MGFWTCNGNTSFQLTSWRRKRYGLLYDSINNRYKYEKHIIYNHWNMIRFCKLIITIKICLINGWYINHSINQLQ